MKNQKYIGNSFVIFLTIFMIINLSNSQKKPIYSESEMINEISYFNDFKTKKKISFCR